MLLNTFTPLRLLALLMLALMLPAEADAQRRKRQRGPTPDAITLANLQKHVGVLAHDSLEGRRTGTSGEQKAISYIVNQYKALGIAGGGTQGSYLQPFTIDEGKEFAPKSSLRIDEQELIPNEDYFAFAWSAPGKIAAGTLVALNESGEPWWMDIKHMLEENAGNPHFILSAHLQQVAKNAAAEGASTLILYNSGTRPDSLAFQPRDRSDAVAIPVVYITRKAVKQLGIDYESAPEVELVVELTPVTRQGTNVLAMINNDAPQTIVIGAHFDHLGYGEDHNSRHTGEADIHNGADDNASGTAAVIELARLLGAQKDATFNYLFLHFSGEELGLYGSKYFVDNPTIDLAGISYMINLDMVGRLADSSKALTIGGVGTSPAWGRILPPTTDFTFKVDSSGTGPSDHTSFYRKNIPVLFFFTGLHTDYHKPSDDADKINYAGMVKLVNYIQQIVQRSPAGEKLAFTKTREQTMGGRGFKVSIGIMPDYTYSGTGVKADGLIEGRAAQKAGLVAGDIILQLGEVLITGMDMYMEALNRFEKGQTTTITVKRANEVVEMPITF